MEELSISINNIWVLVAAFLVMFMQPGFAMVEAGFTRSKNTANILTKNLVDFSLGAILYWAIGYTLMYGESIGGFIGKPILFLNDNGIGDYANTTDLFFQTVFAATAATIVSGAIAGRTKFTTYLIFSVVMTVIIYPISGHWVWQGDGWLTELGFIDFAGSTVVHSVGGWAALIAAILVGP
jgi:Amt family ammonium transporter